jgi:hypothetical protein
MQCPTSLSFLHDPPEKTPSVCRLKQAEGDGKPFTFLKYNKLRKSPEGVGASEQRFTASINEHGRNGQA